MFSQDIKQCKLALNDLNSLTDLKKGVQKLIESEAEDVADQVSKLVQDSMSQFKLLDQKSFSLF